uniref:Uncharacterized protein n=1 Tax=Pyramimonas obovata TaxID=1411642 RepID=A0A7S0WWD4_9CHLO|mmetsp:Transcript_7200/g.14622  ORF Transcript_7200/g.14622 Transcript_7200/m.14622 type:complete len:325 (+) Transcript_7200:204-1178(+)|eukprot:CAMPEP_0118929122 /NCGR_PEP_ID=MMETSP1169-20130426/6211_1 /TAXON_ID=36882 /ORGANISM="Pyramimonas obovata, Strain CCMP722" /LENGTH=324 /DNA_ID=CAMNT_0006871249 /DNA_START=198 /DNA_END=1172 /DNA_ORIENTATION=-
MSGVPHDPYRHGLHGVSPAEIRAFRTSMSSRRFPALREMRDEDIAVLVIANKKVQKKRLLGTSAGLAEVMTGPADAVTDLHDHMYSNPPLLEEGFPMPQGMSFPGTGSSLGYGGTPYYTEKRRPPFRPNNPSQAKEDIGRTAKERYLFYQAPYEKANTREEMAEASKGLEPFVPNGSLRAKEKIAVHYYLNSPDEETLALEKSYISQRASVNKQMMLSGTYGRVKGFDSLNEGSINGDTIAEPELPAAKPSQPAAPNSPRAGGGAPPSGPQEEPPAAEQPPVEQQPVEPTSEQPSEQPEAQPAEQPEEQSAEPPAEPPAEQPAE